MNDFLSQLQKVGSWLWSQKEKMVLIALVGVLCYRVYVVVSPPKPKAETAETTKKAAVPKKPPVPPPDPPVWPPPRTATADASGLTRMNPFTIYGVQTGDNTSGKSDEEQTIPVTLTGFKKWKDSVRAMLKVGEDRVRPYAEQEPFGAYILERIDVDAQTVDVYSQEYDKTFTLQVQGGG